MKLNKAQKEAVLRWIAEGLETDEINKRAAKFKPRFSVSRQQVDHYRDSRGIKLEEIREADETSALITGYALRENRVKDLQTLAGLLFGELTREIDHRRWMLRVKGIGSNDNFERVEEQEFNKAEFDTYRGILDDIAREVGERRPDMVVNNNFNFDMEKWKSDQTQRLAEVADMAE